MKNPTRLWSPEKRAEVAVFVATNITYSAGRNWAERFTNTTYASKGDVVWFEAQAEAAFKRSDLHQNAATTSEDYALHQRAFVSGAVDFFEAAQQTANLGFPVQVPDPTPVISARPTRFTSAYQRAFDGTPGGLLVSE